jgi:hypothetical protein
VGQKHNFALNLFSNALLYIAEKLNLRKIWRYRTVIRRAGNTIPNGKGQDDKQWSTQIIDNKLNIFYLG